MPLLWLPRFKGEGAGFGMEILNTLCGSRARGHRYQDHCDLGLLHFYLKLSLTEVLMSYGQRLQGRVAP